MFRNKTSIFKWHLCPYFNWNHVSNETLFFLGDQNYSQRFIRCIKIHQMPWLFVRISSSCRCRHCCAAFLFFFYFIFALRNFMELLFWHRGANGYGLEVIKTDQHFQRWKCTKAKWRCFFIDACWNNGWEWFGSFFIYDGIWNSEMEGQLETSERTKQSFVMWEVDVIAPEIHRKRKLSANNDAHEKHKRECRKHKENHNF